MSVTTRVSELPRGSAANHHYRLSNLLEQLLQDSNWTTQMTDSAASKAKTMEELNLDELVRGVVDEGKSECAREKVHITSSGSFVSHPSYRVHTEKCGSANAQANQRIPQPKRRRRMTSSAGSATSHIYYPPTVLDRPRPSFSSYTSCFLILGHLFVLLSSTNCDSHEHLCHSIAGDLSQFGIFRSHYRRII